MVVDDLEHVCTSLSFSEMGCPIPSLFFTEVVLELCIVCVVDVTWTESVNLSIYLVLGFHRVEMETLGLLSSLF